MKKSVLRKLLVIILAFAMLAPIMANLGINVGEVQAAEEEKLVGYVVVPSSAVTICEPTDTKQPKVMSVNEDDVTYGEYADYIFAGWYTDAEATIASSSGTTGAYARFVPADVLSTKVQVTNGIVTSTTIDNYRDKYVMRFVSSVDSKDYQYAGFELSYEDKTTNEKVTLESKTYKVFKRIDSTTGSTDYDVDTYEFSPKVVDTKSEYFITSKMPIAETDKDVNYTVKAYWVTKDGTKVYGRERCVSVEDGATETAKTRLNLTVDAELNKQYSYSVSYKNRSKATVTSSNVEVLTSGNGYSNIRIKTADKDTQSMTCITIISENDGSTYTAMYRNLHSKYEVETGTPTFDTTWYTQTKTENEYIIATRADMYGFALLVDSGEEKYPFSDAKVYLVSDIALNPEELEMLEGDNYLKWYTYGKDNQKVYQDIPSYTWNPIGQGSTNTFKGIFDGQGHTISGLYFNTTTAPNDNNTRWIGLFSQIEGSAIIKNLKLKNSYLKHNQSDFGSVVGTCKGTLNTVYSNAIVECSAARSGGVVGQYGGTESMTNCWFAGKIISGAASYQGMGGLVGNVSAGASLTMTSCLNTGLVDASRNTRDNVPCAGGFVGQVAKDSSGNKAKFIIHDSLNVGEIRVNATSKLGYGSIVGYASGTANITETYAADGCRGFADGDKGNVTKDAAADVKLTINDIKGTDAQSKMPLLDWETETTDGRWTTIEGSTPVLTALE